MPAPPGAKESQNEFLSRCISYLIKHEGKTSKQAAGQCYGMWRQRHKVAAKAKKTSKTTH